MSSIDGFSVRYAKVDTSLFLPKVNGASGDAAAKTVNDTPPADASSPDVVTNGTFTLTKAKFSDMYTSRVFAMADANGDQAISQMELRAQMPAGDGANSLADALYKKMDADGNGTVSEQEFKDSIPDPFAKNGYAQKIQELLDQLKAGQSSGPYVGPLLNAQGQFSHQDEILRNLAQQFTGNL